MSPQADFHADFAPAASAAALPRAPLLLRCVVPVHNEEASLGRFVHALALVPETHAPCTNLPLRVWSVIGSLVALLALGYCGFILLETMLYGNALAGCLTLAAGIMLCSGVQWMSIGILGEYIGRIYDEVKHRPSYLVARDEDRSPWRGDPP